MDSYETIKKHVYKDGKLIHYACNPLWYTSKGIEWILELIKSATGFMPVESTIRERLYYIENNIDSILLCKYCYTRPIKLKQGNTPRKSCGHTSCLSTIKSINSTTSAALLKADRVKYEAKVQRCRETNKGRVVTEQQRSRMRDSHLGKTQSEHTIRKRVNSRRGYKHSQSTIEKIRQSNIKTKKERGPRIVTQEYRDKKSAELKARIANGSWTPCITSTWTRWENRININGIDRKFRSSWEMAFWLCNQHLKFEVTRIAYINDDGKQCTYIVDFTDENLKILYEIKPSGNIEDKKVQLKAAAAIKWCKESGYVYKVVSNRDIRELNVPEEYRQLPFYQNILKIKG